MAISTDSGFVSMHFGRCPEFTIVEIDHNRVIKKETVANPGHHPGFLPQFLKEQGVGIIVAGGMGARAQELFNQAGIDFILGAEGKIEDIIEQLIAGKLISKESLCKPGLGKGYGVDKTVCDHPHEEKE